MTHPHAGIGMRLCHRVMVWIVGMVLAIAACVSVPFTAMAADENDSADGVSLAIAAATAMVTAGSGYHLTLDITNGTDHDLPSGTLTLATNAYYTFVSRNDIQQWAQNEVGIPTPQVLAESTTPGIAAGTTSSISIDVAADDETLSSILEWGPKPVRLTFRAGDVTSETHTFLTRSSEGLHGQQTPAMNVTVVVPLTTSQWQYDSESLQSLLSEGVNLSADTVIDLDEEGEEQVQRHTQLLNKHPDVQVVADPVYLNAMRMPVQSAAIMQPGAFDITAYAADASRFDQTGLSTDAWNAEAALAYYQQAIGDEEATLAGIAWQGAGNWTTQALTTAKQQGYDAVIATDGFNDTTTGTVHTDTYVVPTEAGDITVLSAQPVLTGLAQGQATSEKATAERTAAGRLTRFVAQSAFYQMEQPYTSRNLLICLDPTTATNDVDTILTAIEQAPWLQMTDLDTLMAVAPYASGDLALQSVPEANGIDQSTRDGVNHALDVLTNTDTVIARFADAILTEAQAEPLLADEDAQALARQDAEYAARRAPDTSSWIELLRAVNRRFALHALSGDAQLRDVMVSGSQTIADTMANAVSITPMETVNVVSETASMPVTVSNRLPYPIRVRVSAKTDSMTIVTARFADVVVPPTSEEQTTFAIRVSTSGSTTAQMTLLDRQGAAFGTPQSTTITSALQLSDMSGFAIIAFAVLLGVLGLWRQFHRVKDPDE